MSPAIWIPIVVAIHLWFAIPYFIRTWDRSPPDPDNGPIYGRPPDIPWYIILSLPVVIVLVWPWFIVWQIWSRFRPDPFRPPFWLDAIGFVVTPCIHIATIYWLTG